MDISKLNAICKEAQNKKDDKKVVSEFQTGLVIYLKEKGLDKESEKVIFDAVKLDTAKCLIEWFESLDGWKEVEEKYYSLKNMGMMFANKDNKTIMLLFSLFAYTITDSKYSMIAVDCIKQLPVLLEKAKELSYDERSGITKRYFWDNLSDKKEYIPQSFLSLSSNDRVLAMNFLKSVLVVAPQEIDYKEKYEKMLVWVKSVENAEDISNLNHGNNENDSKNENNNETNEVNNQKVKLKNGDEKDKKNDLPISIKLKDKSDKFQLIIKAALEYEEVEKENEKYLKKNNEFKEKIKKLTNEKKELEKELANAKQEVNQLKNKVVILENEVSGRDDIIKMQKKDKVVSKEEDKNALGAALKMYYGDYLASKEEEMNADIGLFVQDTLEAVFRELKKNGVTFE